MSVKYTGRYKKTRLNIQVGIKKSLVKYTGRYKNVG